MNLQGSDVLYLYDQGDNIRHRRDGIPNVARFATFLCKRGVRTVIPFASSFAIGIVVTDMFSVKFCREYNVPFESVSMPNYIGVLMNSARLSLL